MPQYAPEGTMKHWKCGGKPRAGFLKPRGVLKNPAGFLENPAFFYFDLFFHYDRIFILGLNAYVLLI